MKATLFCSIGSHCMRGFKVEKAVELFPNIVVYINYSLINEDMDNCRRRVENDFANILNDLNSLDTMLNNHYELLNQLISVMGRKYNFDKYEKLKLQRVAMYLYMFAYSNLFASLLFVDYRTHIRSSSKCKSPVINELVRQGKEISVKNIRKILMRCFPLQNTTE